MYELLSLLNHRITENRHQDLKSSIYALLPPEAGCQLEGGWIDGSEVGMESDPEASGQEGIGQITVVGNKELPEDIMQRIADLGDSEGSEVMQHPLGDFQGEAVMVNGEKVWIEGLAAELFGGNVFDMALSGHPASMQFLVKVLPLVGEEIKPMLLKAMQSIDDRPAVRELVEERSGVSFADDALYYGKGESGLGNVYSAIELGI